MTPVGPVTPVGPPPAPTTDPTTGTTPPPGGKPAAGDEVKVRVKQIHPLVAKVMAKVLTPPVLATIGLALVGLEVLAWLTLGWAGAIGLPILVALTVFAGAVAWRKAGIAKKAAAARKQTKKADPAGRRSLLDLLVGRRRPAGRDGAGSPADGGGAGYRGAHRGGRGLLGGLLDRARRAAGGGARGGSGGGRGGAPGGSSGGGAQGGGSVAPGGKGKGLFGRLARRVTRRRGGAGGGPSGGGTGGGGHGSPSTGPGGGKPRGGLPRLRLPSFLRRKGGGGPAGSGGGPTGGWQGGGQDGSKRTRRGRRGRGGRGQDTAAGSGQPDTGRDRKPGFVRRQIRGVADGIRQTTNPQTTNRQTDKQPARKDPAKASSPDPRRATKPQRPGEPPMEDIGNLVKAVVGRCDLCNGPLFEGDRVDRLPDGRRIGAACCEKVPADHPARRPAAPARPQETRREDREQRPAPVHSHKPQHGARNEGNTTMGINSREDASLQGWGRSLKDVSPVIDEFAGQVAPLDDLLSGIAQGLKNLANVGRDDLPAEARLVAEVEEVATKAERYRADLETLLANIRGLSTQAESLYPMYVNNHDTDEGRLAGERGGVDKEKRADVGYAQQDT